MTIDKADIIIALFIVLLLGLFMDVGIALVVLALLVVALLVLKVRKA